MMYKTGNTDTASNPTKTEAVLLADFQTKLLYQKIKKNKNKIKRNSHLIWNVVKLIHVLCNL